MKTEIVVRRLASGERYTCDLYGCQVDCDLAHDEPLPAEWVQVYQGKGGGRVSYYCSLAHAALGLAEEVARG